MKLSYIKKTEPKEQVQSGNKISKEFLATSVNVDPNERTIVAVITTSAVDRYNEVVLTKGADLENYLKNPIVLWAHESWKEPIARAVWLKKQRNKITAKLQFPEKDVSEIADRVYNLYKGGYLKAFSIGFNPDFDKIRKPTEEEIEKKPEWANVRRIFEEWELLEFSAVPVPANPEALATAVKSNDIEYNKKFMEQLGYEVEDDDDEEIHLATNVTVTDNDATHYAFEIDMTNDDVTADAPPLVVKEFYEAEQVITAEADYEVTPFEVLSKKQIVKDGMNNYIKYRKGRIYE